LEKRIFGVGVSAQAQPTSFLRAQGIRSSASALRQRREIALLLVSLPHGDGQGSHDSRFHN
jgi:hypothetical protein